MDLFELRTSNREMTCPYCGRSIGVDDMVGIVKEKENEVFHTYACENCYKRHWVYSLISNSLFIGGALLIFLYCLLNDTGALFGLFMTIIWLLIIGIPLLLLKVILGIREVKYGHAQNCNAIAPDY